MQLCVRYAFFCIFLLIGGLCTSSLLSNPKVSHAATLSRMALETPMKYQAAVYTPSPQVPNQAALTFSPHEGMAAGFSSPLFVLLLFSLTSVLIYAARRLAPARHAPFPMMAMQSVDSGQSPSRMQLPEDELRLLLQTIKEGIIGVDKFGKVTFANDFALSTLGYTEAELLGRNLHETVHSTFSADNPCQNKHCALRKALEHCPESVEIKDLFFMRKDNSIFPVHITISPIRNDKYDFGISLVFSDITDQHDLQEQLWAIYNATNDAYFIFSHELKLMSCNPAAKQLFGIADIQEAIDHFDRFSPYTQMDGNFSQRKFKFAMQKALDTGYTSFEWTHLNTRGEYIPCEIFLERILLRGQFAIFSCVHDLRKIKSAQVALEAERQQLQTILDTSPFGLTFTYDGEITFANQYMSSHFGVRNGQHTPTRIHVPRIGDTSNFSDSTVLMDGLSVQSIDADGNSCDLLLTSVTGTLHGKSGVLSWVVDISDVKKAERESALARKAAEEAARAKSEFLAHMSHEIRTPLNAIQGMCHLLQQTLLNEIQQKYLRQLRSASGNLLGVINSVLDFARVESGRVKLEYTPFLLSSITTRIYDVLALRAEEKGLELSVEIAADIPNVLQGDPLRLGQILINLMSNAIKFTDHGFVKLRIIVDEIVDETYYLHLTVQDTGIGLPAETLKDIFQPFIQADSSTTRKYGGTGLGLAICKSLADMMNGTIWVTSTFGQGCTFHVRIPMKRLLYSAEDLQENPPIALLVAPQTLQSEYTHMLEAMGFQIETVVTCADAILAINEQAREKPYQLLFIDGHPITAPPSGLQLQCFIDGFATVSKVPVLLCALTQQQAAFLQNFSSTVPFRVIAKRDVDAAANASDTFNALACYFAHLTENNSASKLELHCSEEALVRIAGSKILLVEDNDTNQEIAAALLGQLNMQLVLANNGQEALQKIAEQDFDLVLMDIQMPVMDGLEASRCIRAMPDARYQALPIIALTAHVGTEDYEKSMKAGMNAHLTKPLEPELLSQALVQWIDPDNLNAANFNSATLAVPDAAEKIILPKALPGIDLEKGLGHVSQNTELFHQILTRFPQRYGQSIEEIRTALKHQNLEEATRLAHTVKGISATLGATEFSNIMRDIEHALMEGSNTTDLLKQADTLLAAIINGITILLAPQKSSTVHMPSQISREQRDHALDDLNNLPVWLETDLFRASTALKELEIFSEHPECSQVYQQLMLAFQDFEMDQVRQHSKKLEEILHNMETAG